MTILLLLLPLSTKAQNNISSSSIKQFLDSKLGRENLPVFNGIRFYDLFNSTTENYRYLNSYKPFLASITYDGQLYDSILTRYDLINDHLIVHTEGKLSFFQVQLANEKINSFKIDSLYFVKRDLGKTFEEGKNHFYELAYMGNDFELLISWSKVEKLNARTQNSYYSFKTTQHFYLKKEGTYFEINSIRDLIELFPNRKKELKQFYKNFKKLNKRDSRKFMQKLALYLDETKK